MIGSQNAQAITTSLEVDCGAHDKNFILHFILICFLLLRSLPNMWFEVGKIHYWLPWLLRGMSGSDKFCIFLYDNSRWMAVNECGVCGPMKLYLGVIRKRWSKILSCWRNFCNLCGDDELNRKLMKSLA